MEHTLGDINEHKTEIEAKRVLILVLVEHTLGVMQDNENEFGRFVLILVLVEHTLGASQR